MQVAGKAKSVLTIRQAIIIFLVLAIFTIDAVSILYVFGRLTLWESAATLFTVLALAAGTICTALWVTEEAS